MPHVGFLCCKPLSLTQAPVSCSAALILHHVRDSAQSFEPLLPRSVNVPKSLDLREYLKTNAWRINLEAPDLVLYHPSSTEKSHAYGVRFTELLCFGLRKGRVIRHASGIGSCVHTPPHKLIDK